VNLDLGSPEVVYNKLYKDYESGNYRETLIKTDIAIVQFTGEEMLPKYELLKANLIGKLYGLTEYKKALNFVALTYPNVDEGKQTEKFIATKIPLLESLYFNDDTATNWKIIYQPKTLDEKDSKVLLEKLNKFVKERTVEKLTLSTDVYTKERNLTVIHGIKTEQSVIAIRQILKDYKEYKISDDAIAISSENYKIVQIYKNIDEYIAGTGPNWIAKEKPEIVLPKEEVAVKTNDEAKNSKGQAASNTSKNTKEGMQSNDTDDQQNIGTPPSGEPKKR